VFLQVPGADDPVAAAVDRAAPLQPGLPGVMEGEQLGRGGVAGRRSSGPQLRVTSTRLLPHCSGWNVRARNEGPPNRDILAGQLHEKARHGSARTATDEG